MKLADLATGSDWIVWIVFAIFAVLSIILLSGHGSWFISGYNTASNEEKEKYDEKKLCRTMGIGMSIIAILALTMGLFENILPAFFVYIALGIILVDVVDAAGEAAGLDYIDFVKVQTGVNIQGGAGIGELSTEVSRFRDENL